MAELFSILSLVFYILAASFLILTVYFWFRFDIPKVIDDLTLKSAKKQIAQMYAEASKTGDKAGKTDKSAKRRAAANPETGLLADNSGDEEVNAVTELLDSPGGDPDATVMMDLPTGLLAEAGDSLPAQTSRSGGVELTILEEIMIVHTEEVI